MPANRTYPGGFREAGSFPTGPRADLPEPRTPRSDPMPARRTGPLRWVGTLPVSGATVILVGAVLLGLAATIATGKGPGALITYLLIVGSVVAAAGVRRSSAYKIIPLPAVTYLVAVLVAGALHDGLDLQSTTRLGLSFASWIGSGFLGVVVATILVLVIFGGRLLVSRQLVSGDFLTSGRQQDAVAGQQTEVLDIGLRNTVDRPPRDARNAADSRDPRTDRDWKGAGVREAGSRDTSRRDNDSWNTGPRNTGSRDTGPRETSPRDTGSRDTGSRDAGSRDAGSRDAGSRDAGSRDTGSRDTGSRNAPVSRNDRNSRGSRDLGGRDQRVGYGQRDSGPRRNGPQTGPDSQRAPAPDSGRPRPPSLDPTDRRNRKDERDDLRGSRRPSFEPRPRRPERPRDTW